jgi:hypothetical protein
MQVAIRFQHRFPLYRPAWDGAGVTLSALCVAHCLLAPLAVAALPTLLWIEDESAHRALALLLVLPAIAAFAGGYRHHRRAGLVALAVVALTAILAAAFAEPPESLEYGLTTVGGLLLIGAHATNRRWCRRCPTCRESEIANTDRLSIGPNCN